MIYKDIKVSRSRFYIHLDYPFITTDLNAYRLVTTEKNAKSIAVTAIRADGKTVSQIDKTEKGCVLKQDIYSIPGELKMFVTISNEEGSIVTENQIIAHVKSGFDSQSTAENNNPSSLAVIAYDTAQSAKTTAAAAKSTADSAVSKANNIEEEINKHEAAKVLDHPDGSVTREKLATGAVSNTKILNDAVDTRTIKPGAVTENELSDEVMKKLLYNFTDISSFDSEYKYSEEDAAYNLYVRNKPDYVPGGVYLFHPTRTVKKIVFLNAEDDGSYNEIVGLLDYNDSFPAGCTFIIQVQDFERLEGEEGNAILASFVEGYNVLDMESRINTLDETVNNITNEFTLKPAAKGVLGGIMPLYKSVSGTMTNRSGLIIAEDGTTYVATTNGVTISGGGAIMINAASTAEVDAGTEQYKPITPKTLSYALSKLSTGDLPSVGDSTGVYSTTPQRVGTWIDGTPIWRAAINYEFSDLDLENIQASNGEHLLRLPVNDNNQVALINEFIVQGLEGMCIVDDQRCKYTASGIWLIPDVAHAANANWLHGWVEFATPENNLSV